MYIFPLEPISRRSRWLNLAKDGFLGLLFGPFHSWFHFLNFLCKLKKLIEANVSTFIKISKICLE
jgi:hypothetical protein